MNGSTCSKDVQETVVNVVILGYANSGLFSRPPPAVNSGGGEFCMKVASFVEELLLPRLACVGLLLASHARQSEVGIHSGRAEPFSCAFSAFRPLFSSFNSRFSSYTVMSFFSCWFSALSLCSSA